MPSAAEIRALEEVGYAIWVSPEVEELDGWRLRAARGMTGRANSVFPNAHGGRDLEAKIAYAEEWYTAREQPVRFQVTAGSLPAGLGGALAARGYEPGGSPVSVQTSDLREADGDRRVAVAEHVDDDWIGVWATSRGFADVGTARALLTGSPGRTAFARVGDVAIGRAVAHDGWLGITSMVTLPAMRRRGLARAIVASLLAWGRSAGATRGFLQTDSPAAKVLYAQFGFAEQYTYSYWLRR